MAMCNVLKNRLVELMELTPISVSTNPYVNYISEYNDLKKSIKRYITVSDVNLTEFILRVPSIEEPMNHELETIDIDTIMRIIMPPDNIFEINKDLIKLVEHIRMIGFLILQIDNAIYDLTIHDHKPLSPVKEMQRKSIMASSDEVSIFLEGKLKDWLINPTKYDHGIFTVFKHTIVKVLRNFAWCCDSFGDAYDDDE